MSSKNLINNTNIISIDERIHVLCTNEAINGKEFAKLVGNLAVVRVLRRQKKESTDKE